MGVRVTMAGDDCIRLSAPLEQNINHRSTVFGGSAAAVGILAGWTLLHVRLAHGGRTTRIVIQRNTIDYHDPIDGDFEAVALPPSAEEWSRFTRLLERRGRSRIDLRVELQRNGETLGDCVGTYVVLPPESGADGQVQP
jgi:thioesterase domain-containing protein